MSLEDIYDDFLINNDGEEEDFWNLDLITSYIVQMFSIYAEEPGLNSFFVNALRGEPILVYVPEGKAIVCVDLIGISKKNLRKYKFSFSWIIEPSFITEDLVSTDISKKTIGIPRDTYLNYDPNDGQNFKELVVKSFSIDNEKKENWSEKFGILTTGTNSYALDPYSLHIACLKPILFFHRLISDEFSFDSSKITVGNLLARINEDNLDEKIEEFNVRFENTLVFYKDFHLELFKEFGEEREKKEKEERRKSFFKNPQSFFENLLEEIYIFLRNIISGKEKDKKEELLFQGLIQGKSQNIDSDFDSDPYFGLRLVKIKGFNEIGLLPTIMTNYPNFIPKKFEKISLLDLFYKNWSTQSLKNLKKIRSNPSEFRLCELFFEEKNGKYEEIFVESYKSYEIVLKIFSSILENPFFFSMSSNLLKLTPYEVMNNTSFKIKNITSSLKKEEKKE